MKLTRTLLWQLFSNLMKYTTKNPYKSLCKHAIKQPHRHGRALVCSCLELLSIGNGKQRTAKRKHVLKKITKCIFYPIYAACENKRNLWKQIYKKILQHKESNIPSLQNRKKDQDSPVKEILLNGFPEVYLEQENYKIHLMFLALLWNTSVYS